MIPFFIESAYHASVLIRRYIMISGKFYGIRKKRASVIDINTIP